MPKWYYPKNSTNAIFVTLTVVGKINIFTKDKYRVVLFDSLQYCRKHKGLKLFGFVFMNTHIHLLVSASDGKHFLWQILRDFKKYTAQIILSDLIGGNNKDLLDIFEAYGKKFRDNKKYRFWNKEMAPREIYTNKFFRQKIKYIHNNPVKAGIVDAPEEYKWSSARLILEGNFVLIDAYDYY